MSLANVVRRHVTPTCIAEGKITVTLIQFSKSMEMILILLLFYPKAYSFLFFIFLYIILTFCMASPTIDSCHNVRCFNCFQLNILCATKENETKNEREKKFTFLTFPHCIHSCFMYMCRNISYFLSILILFQK